MNLVLRLMKNNYSEKNKLRFVYNFKIIINMINIKSMVLFLTNRITILSTTSTISNRIYTSFTNTKLHIYPIWWIRHHFK